MDQERIKEMVKTALMGPVKEDQVEEANAFITAADAARDAGKKEFEFPEGSGKMHPVKIKADIDEMDLNDPVAMRLRADKDKLAKMRAANAGDDGNDKFFDAAKLRALKKKRAEIMRDMEQEAEMEGGPIADKYGDMLNKLDQAIAMLQGGEEKEYTLREDDEELSPEEKANKHAGSPMHAPPGLEEGFYGPGGVESITHTNSLMTTQVQ